MALFAQRTTFVTYAVQPMPGSLAAKWIVAGLIQGALMGLIVHLVYKPAQTAPFTTGPKEPVGPDPFAGDA